MSDFWTQLIQYTDGIESETSDIDNPEHLLSKLLTRAEHERELLEAKFNPISIATRENLSLVSQLHNGITMTKNLLEQHEQLRIQECKLAIELKSRENEAELIAQDFRTTVKRLKSTARIIDYLHCLETLFTYSSALEKSLSTESLDESLSIYSKLSSLTELVHDTSTEHLRVYSTNLALYWYAQLKTAIELRMENVLKLIEFPYIRKMPPNVVIELFDTNRDRLKQELAYALKLRLPNNVKHDDVQSRLRFIGWKPIPLFIHMLLKGLITRFNFHFYGKQKTNDRRKPEWYLNQIITWILDHDDFLTKQLQPLIDEFSDVSPINVKVEFIRGLIELIIVKIDSEITSILSDTTLFTHYIEEILIFSQRLFEEDIDYPQDLPSCMNLLCDEIVFEKWFQVEQDVSRAKLQNIFQSPTAHQSVYERMLERNSDEIKISECAETFLTLLHAMEDRYRHVPYPSCTLRLFSLQVDLLDQFLNDLKDCLHNEQQDIDPLSKYFCSILNSIVYVADVIQQWKDRSHYQRLQYFYEEYKIFIKNNGMDNFVDENSNQIDIDSTLAQQFDLIQLNKKNDLIPASIFDHLLEQYRDEEEKNCNIIVNHIVSTLKAKSRRYINEKWSAMPNPKDYFSMNISSSAIDVLLELQTTFANLSINLLKNVSNEIRARVIKQFDEYLFNRIINDYTFNEGGAAQFLFDMNRGWSRIVNDSFSQLFNKCRESALLLTMPIGSALLLVDALQQDLSLASLTDSSSKDPVLSSPLPSALHEMGIHSLSEFEADQVLQRRRDLTNC
ncbi:unnamed protein product [Rotaria magnacalcarata]|uniref:RAD50-interacting protein 1 n=2 Tax=Rotaria magnacalcarata TaxID=392030 RepID=A0A815RNL9_9BILA|nr:unnamed protein product [Rotaria magnacalcarata]CAF1480095.1 unnamed protein product [Rotaria magnacalcarata]CAF1933806.1 unnamed protein product [Rotaria magnacalcarata]